MRRTLWMFASAALVLVLVASTAPTRTLAGQTFPDIIPLPNGWLPEGVVTGKGPVIYAGSRANGAIYEANLRTGEGRILVPGTPGRIAVGLSFDERSGYIFAAGGANGNAFVYDSRTGAEVGTYQFASAPTFVNDVIVTREAAYFTDSQRPVLYRVALGSGGRLSEPGDFELIPMSGDYQHVAGFNANGIEASPNGKHLIIVHSTLGLLYEVDPTTGVATTIDLGGYSVSNGDGLLLEGRTLYVVRNRNNLIAEFKLSPDLSSGTLVAEITDTDFDVPTTVARFGDSLYAVNARFTTPPTPQTEYDIVRVDR